MPHPSDLKATVAHNLNVSRQSTLSAKWFVAEREYDPVGGSFEFLICGEEAFGALYDAIAAARHSVCLISWAFQPSMYLRRGLQSEPIWNIRNNYGFNERTGERLPGYEWDGKRCLPIGELLRQKAIRDNVKVRVLTWIIDLGLGFNVAGVSGEANTPGWGSPKLGEKLPMLRQRNTGTDGYQHSYDKLWYSLYDTTPSGLRAKDAGEDPAVKSGNLQFRGRGFNLEERDYIMRHDYADTTISAARKGLLAAVPTHHQKMALIDYEDRENHVGFVMGHNLLDEYWDTRRHSHWRESDGCLGRNGALPREDLSSRITGPVVGNIFRNFQQAWEKETGETLPEPQSKFSEYPVKKGAKFISCHLIRTQPQHKAHTIRDSYLHALNNASECIYVENQYFRWPPFADKVREAAARIVAKGADPRQWDALYLFVVTNSSEEGMGLGALSTTQMLESLGRADAMPQAARQNRCNELAAEIAQNDTQIENIEAQINALKKPAYVTRPSPADLQRHEAARVEIKRLEAAKAEAEERRKALAAEKERLDRDEKAETIVPREIPGLKIHVCTLVPPDLPPLAEHWLESRNVSGEMEKSQASRDVDKRRRYQALDEQFLRAGNATYWRDADGTLFWPEVYVHSKLLIVDDTYMSLGSANINNKSMEGDSELNIAHFDAPTTLQARLDLWGMHTAGYVDKEGKASGSARDYKVAFDAWGKLIKRNREKEEAGEKPIASLRGFLRTDPSLKDLD